MHLAHRIRGGPGKTVSLLLFMAALLAAIIYGFQPESAEAQADQFVVTGEVFDVQGQPLMGAEAQLFLVGDDEPLDRTETSDEGLWSLRIPEVPDGVLVIELGRRHFMDKVIRLTGLDLEGLRQNRSIDLGQIQMEREISAAFWVATIVFLGVLLVIAFEKLHSTTAALAGTSAIFLISSVGGAINPALFIFDFEQALEYINWEVIFLVMAMMIIVAIIERTGIFQWAAFQAYRLSRGRAWLLVLILMLLTAVASALLDNFTTMLLMTPISLQIGLALGINPLALIIPEVLASNVGGITTLIGTPTNILIGAHAGIGFQDFLVNQTIGVVFGLILMGAYVLYHYRDEWKKHPAGISETLYQRLEENARLRNPENLWKSGLIFLLVLVGFVIGERYHVVPAVPALIGATTLLVWLKPDVHAMITAVDWTTLVFFMTLFIVVGAVQEVGLISLFAVGMSKVIGESLILGIFVIVIGVGTLSTVIANIPLSAAMLPVVDFLSGSIPGATNKALYYALSMGAAMGGNGLLIGAEANLVTAGITSQAGTPISFKEFLKVGLPVTYLTLTAGFLWLLLRFVVLA